MVKTKEDKQLENWNQKVFEKFAEIVWYLEKLGIKQQVQYLTVDGERNYKMTIKFEGNVKNV